jgi:hypothetical protein
MNKEIERRYLQRVKELMIDIPQGKQFMIDEVMRLIEDAFNEGQQKKNSHA